MFTGTDPWGGTSTGKYTIQETGIYKMSFRTVFTTEMHARGYSIIFYVNDVLYSYWSGNVIDMPSEPEYYTATIEAVDLFNVNTTLHIGWNETDAYGYIQGNHTNMNITRIY